MNDEHRIGRKLDNGLEAKVPYGMEAKDAPADNEEDTDAESDRPHHEDL